MANGYYTGYLPGNGTVRGPGRRKHNGRLRRLPHRGMLKAKTVSDLHRLDWAFNTLDGYRYLIRKLSE